MSEEQEEKAPCANIHQRILAVMKDLIYIKKDSTVNTGGGRGYKAVTHDKVVSEVRSLFIKYGIGFGFTQNSSDFEFKTVINKDGTQAENQVRRETGMYSGEYVITFYNADNPDDFVESVVNAHAFGNDDKNPGKAASYAVKTAILKQFLIETGEDEESRTYDYLADTISEQDLETVRALVSQAQPDIDRFNEVFGITDLKELTNEQFGRARAMLEAKKQQNANTNR